MMSMKDQEFEKLVEFVKSNFGINLSNKRVLIEGRLSHLVAEKGFETYEGYLNHVFADKTGTEITCLINRLTTNHTYFMREVSHFDYFQNHIIPSLADTMHEKDLRIWSAGCSTGEEPYTLAMIIADYFGSNQMAWDTKILATDLSTAVLRMAYEGIYSLEEVQTLPKMWQLNYFDKVGADNYQVKLKIRNEVIFRLFNLMEIHFPFKKKFHVIFCRNVMIYFDAETKAQLVQRFYNALEYGGHFFIGHSESIDRAQSPFKYVMPSVYRKE